MAVNLEEIRKTRLTIQAVVMMNKESRAHPTIGKCIASSM